MRGIGIWPPFTIFSHVQHWLRIFVWRKRRYVGRRYRERDVGRRGKGRRGKGRRYREGRREGEGSDSVCVCVCVCISR